ncbi:MAG TPA: AAA family ATPase [Chloroflexota bacterium]|nr:AAA family ATPase [Chloroflexota bacterium]
MPIIAVSNQKGGVGKTTSTLNLGAALREMGKTVLLVDLDPQGSLTVAAGVIDVDAIKISIGDLLMARAQGAPQDISRAIITTPAGIDLVPGNGMLSAAELTLATAMARESALLATLKPALERYDYILIDCLPSLGLIAINALRASDGVVIPVQADFLAVQGLAQILETIGAVREQLNPALAVYGVLLTMVDLKKSHSQRVVATVRHSLADQVPVFDTEIVQHVAYKEAAEAGQTILEYQPRSSAAQVYRNLAHEVALAAGDKAIATVAVKRGGFFAEAGRLWRGLTRGRDTAESGRTLARAA